MMVFLLLLALGLEDSRIPNFLASTVGCACRCEVERQINPWVLRQTSTTSLKGTCEQLYMYLYYRYHVLFDFHLLMSRGYQV